MLEYWPYLCPAFELGSPRLGRADSINKAMGLEAREVGGGGNGRQKNKERPKALSRVEAVAQALWPMLPNFLRN